MLTDEPRVLSADPASAGQRNPAIAAESDWPAEVEMILSALESGRHRPQNRRLVARMPMRVRGQLRLFSDDPQSPPHVIYTRDVHPRGLGFLTQDRLPLSHGGLIHLPVGVDGSIVSVHCTLLRCREAAPGWYEGSVYFNREQTDLEP